MINTVMTHAKSIQKYLSRFRGNTRLLYCMPCRARTSLTQGPFTCADMMVLSFVKVSRLSMQCRPVFSEAQQAQQRNSSPEGFAFRLAGPPRADIRAFFLLC